MNFYASQKLADDVDYDDRTSYSDKASSIYSGIEFENEIFDGMCGLVVLLFIHYLYPSHFIGAPGALEICCLVVERL